MGLIKKEEEELKAHIRREAQRNRLREKSHARGLTASYLNDRYDGGTTNDDDEESIAAIKNRAKPGQLLREPWFDAGLAGKAFVALGVVGGA